MRVLVVIHAFPPVSEGGSEVYAHAHARTLRREHGDEVLVLTREQRPDAPEYRVRRESRDGLSIAWINNTFRSTRTFEETYRNPAIAALARQVIDQFRPDIAHIHHLTCLSTAIVGLLAERQVPIIFTLHDYWLICHRGQLLDRDLRVCDGPGPDGCHACVGPEAGMPEASSFAAPMIRALERRLPGAAAGYLRKAVARTVSATSSAGQSAREAAKRLEHMRTVASRVTRFLAPSAHLAERFRRFGVPADRITMSEYGIDHTPFAAVVRRPSSHLRIGFLGTLMVSKAPSVLLEAFRRLPQGAATVDLIGPYSGYHGDDSYRATLDPLLRLPGVHVHGAVTHDRVVGLLGAIDVLVVPSIWPENSPLVIREAFLAGVPVVASRIGGIPETVEDGRSGLLFRPGDADDLLRALTRLISEPGLLDRLRAGIPVVRTIEDDVRATRALYEAHIGRRVTPASAPSTTAPPRLAAVVLNYRTPDETFLAVTSLLASRRRIDEIIVVDNDAGSGLDDRLRPHAGVVQYVATGENRGFSGGMNAGIRAALAGGAARVLLVNSDVIVPPDCVGLLEDSLGGSVDPSGQIGIVGPAVFARSDPGSVASLGISYAPGTGRMRHRGFGVRMTPAEPAETTVVDGVSGCLMLIAREVFEAIGVFDEDYFFSFEELDFCLRAREAGFRTTLVGRARAYHEGGRSIGAQSMVRLYYAARNHLRLASRTTKGNAAASAARTASIVALNLAHAVLAPGGSMPARVGAVLRGTKDYMAGRFGGADGRSAGAPR